jgi:hypothetical protein
MILGSNPAQVMDVYPREISGFHIGECEHDSLLGYSAL